MLGVLMLCLGGNRMVRNIYIHGACATVEEEVLEHPKTLLTLPLIWEMCIM